LKINEFDIYQLREEPQQDLSEKSEVGRAVVFSGEPCNASRLNSVSVIPAAAHFVVVAKTAFEEFIR
jgi:hypothetical protein